MDIETVDLLNTFKRKILCRIIGPHTRMADRGKGVVNYSYKIYEDPSILNTIRKGRLR